MLLVFARVYNLQDGVCYSPGQGIVVEVKSQTDETITVISHSGDEPEELILPKASVVLVENVEVFDCFGNTQCMTCHKELGHAIWVTGEKQNCNLCYAANHANEKGARYEYDPTIKRWIKTATFPEAYFQVEYDLNYWGGDYNKVGEFFLVPQSVVDAIQAGNVGNYYDDESLPAAFTQVTGWDHHHVINYNLDELKDHNGEALEV